MRQSPKRTDPRYVLAHQVDQNIHIVATLGQQHKGAAGFVSPVAAHKAVSLMHRIDQFELIDADDIADFAGGDQPFCFAINRLISQRMTNTDDAAVLPAGRIDCDAIRQHDGHRFFQQHVIAEF